MISVAVVLLITAWFWSVDTTEPVLPEAEPVAVTETQNTTRFLVPVNWVEPPAQVNAELSERNQTQEPAAAKPEQASSICLQGRGCTLDLQENWHLQLISANKKLSRAKLELLFKSKNFREAAEQLHYSHQYVQDNQLEQNLDQALSALAHKFSAGTDALGCRDAICLVQLRLPIEVKADEVLKQLSGVEPPWQHVYMSELKTKTHWQIRLLVKAEPQL